MARKRMIDPDSWTDEKIAELSIFAHLLWVGTISLADDEGRLEWSARQLRIRLFPGKADVSVTHVEKWMDELVSNSVVSVYESGGFLYAVHPNWRRHQYVNKPVDSKFPAPPEIATLPLPHSHGKKRGRPFKARANSGELSSTTLIAPKSPELLPNSPVPLESESDSESDSELKSESESESEFRKTSSSAAGENDLVVPSLPTSLPSTLPEEIGALKRVAVPFLAAFANVTTPEARKKHGDAYVEALAIFRSRGTPVADVWAAFGDAWLARDGKPLFGAMAKKAVSFLPQRGAANGRGTRAADDMPVMLPRSDMPQ